MLDSLVENLPQAMLVGAGVPARPLLWKDLWFRRAGRQVTGALPYREMRVLTVGALYVLRKQRE